MAPKSKAQAKAAAAAAAAAPPVEQAPKQEVLESQPLNAEPAPHSYGLHHFSKKFPTPDEIDKKMPKKMAQICNEWVVGTHQFDEMENAGGALVCARVLRGFLIFFIITSSIGLCVGFFFKASLAAPMETEQYGELPAPGVVLCGSPWGTDFLGFDVVAVQQGLIPGRKFEDIPSANWTVQNFNSSLGGTSAVQLTGCKLLELHGIDLKPHGKVAQYTAFETIRLTLNAQSEDGKFNFGFSNGDGELPQRWSYGALGSRLSGEIQYDQVNVGASDVSEGVPRSILSYKSTGAFNLGTTKTELEYFYGYFMVRVLAAQAKGLTIFAIVAFVLLLAAALNNCGLFELFFVEFIPDDEPPPELVPNLVCQAVCGHFFSSCRRRKNEDKSEDGDPEEAKTA